MDITFPNEQDHFAKSTTCGTPIRLHLGCGNRHLPGYINCDIRPEVHPDKICNVLGLHDFANDYVDSIYFCHGIEHLTTLQVAIALAEWHRILKPGGFLRLSCPDFGILSGLYTDCHVSLDVIHGPLMGRQDYSENTHLSMWDFSRLYVALKEARYINIGSYYPERIWPSGYDDYSYATINGKSISLNMQAIKKLQ